MAKETAEDLVEALPRQWRVWHNCNTEFLPLAPFVMWRNWTKTQYGSEYGLMRRSKSLATAIILAPPGPYCSSPAGSVETAIVDKREFAQCPPEYTPWGAVNDVPMCKGPPKQRVVVLDPGHGLSCPQAGEKIGAEGATDFPASNPPLGRLREDVVTVEIAQETRRIMASPATLVLLTKGDVNSCPTLIDRQRFATDHDADVLISIHVDAARPPTVPHGTLAFHHPGSFRSQDLASRVASEVSSRLGLNNRGVTTSSSLAMVKPSYKVAESRVLLEVGRMSGKDEQVLHEPVSRGRAAEGINSAVQMHLAVYP